MLRDSDYRDLCRVEDSSARSVFDADGDSKGVLGAVGSIAKNVLKNSLKEAGKGLLTDLLYGSTGLKGSDIFKFFDMLDKKLRHGDRAALSAALTQIAYGKCNLQEGFYILSATDVTPSSMEDYTFKMPIFAAVDWDSYKKLKEYKRGAWEDIDDADRRDDAKAKEEKELAELQSKFIDKPLTDAYAGDDFWLTSFRILCLATCRFIGVTFLIRTLRRLLLRMSPGIVLSRLVFLRMINLRLRQCGRKRSRSSCAFKLTFLYLHKIYTHEFYRYNFE